ncbi:hypothetical protein LTR43_011905, partial [Exophiala xenobiotica]
SRRQRLKVAQYNPTSKDTMSTRDSVTSVTTKRAYQEDPENTSLSQGVAALQTANFYSQRSTSSRKQDRGPMATEHDNTPSKKRRTREHIRRVGGSFDSARGACLYTSLEVVD